MLIQKIFRAAHHLISTRSRLCYQEGIARPKFCNDYEDIVENVRFICSFTGVVSSEEFLAKNPPAPQAPLPVSSGSARMLDGRNVADQWLTDLGGEVLSVSSILGRPPCLRVLMVGDRADSKVYVQRKLEKCRQVGLAAEVHLLPSGASQEELEQGIRDANHNPRVDGILVQLPLATHMDEARAMLQMDPNKDVDGFHPYNMGSLMMKGRSTRLVPCTALGCLELLRRSGIGVRGKQAVVVGDSNIVGAPLSIGLLRECGAAAVTVCNRRRRPPGSDEAATTDSMRRAEAGACGPAEPSPPSSPHGLSYTDIGFPVDLPAITRTADILVVAVGHPDLVRSDWVKPGAVVLDVGINVVDQSHASRAGGLHVVGDVAFDEVSHVASALSPVPGGIGPMTIAAVVHNTVQAARFSLDS